MTPEDQDFAYTTLKSIAHQASIETLFDFCLIVSERLNIKEIEGIPVEKWLAKRKQERIDSIMIKMEDVSPSAAAKLQTFIDESRKRTGD